MENKQPHLDPLNEPVGIHSVLEETGDKIDPLLLCLEEICRHHNRSVTETVLTAGLPLTNNRLSPDLCVRAAQRVGFAAQNIAISLDKIPPAVLPVILILKDGNACLLLEGQWPRHALIYQPEGNIKQRVEVDALEQMYSGSAIFIKPEFEFDARTVDDVRPLPAHWFWGTLFRLVPTYGHAFLAAAFVNILALASPLFVMNVYDRVLPNKAFPTLWVLALGMTLAIVFDLVLKVLRSKLFDSAGRRADVLLASQIFEHVLNLSLRNKPASSGAFANHLREFEVVREFFTSSTLGTITDLAFLLLFLIIIYMIAGILVLIPLFALILTILIGLAIQAPLFRISREAQAEGTHRHSLLIETVSSLETIKSIRAEGHFQRLWERFVGRSAMTSEKLRHLTSLAATVTGAVQQMVTVALIIGGAYMFDAGELTTGAIIATVMLASRAVAPLGQITLTFARAQHAYLALLSLNKIMELPVDRPEDYKFVDRPVETGQVTFKSVEFSYPGGALPALADFNLTISPGDRIGIIGRIGSGKTTIGRLLTRLYPIDSGSLVIDGIDIRQYHPHEVRKAIALVVQESDLFFGSVRDNIVLGAPSANAETLIRAAKLAGVNDFVAQHPKGFDMPVGERGQYLSGGQRQAVALARAFLLKPRILFLDEPSSSMDMATERQLIQRLEEALEPSQTFIVATHRYSMLSLVNRLIVVDAGRVVADGPKDAVLKALQDRFKTGAPATEQA
ncbi:MAG: type I secretion system permease/ATPase [Pseudomonadota bacterium]